MRDILKKTAVPVILAAEIVLIFFGRIPELPSYKASSESIYGSDVCRYLEENFFAIVFSVISLFIGVVILVYSGYVCRHAVERDIFGKGGITLGLFILLSGIWVLTDSYVLDVFIVNGIIASSDIVNFISYLSFMLLPIVFISFIKNLIHDLKCIEIIGNLLLLNFFVFAVLTALKISKSIYFVSLCIHHALMCILMIIVTISRVRYFYCSENKQEQNIARGVVLFMLFSGVAVLFFFFDSKRLYATVYGIGFAILIIYMIKITIYNVLSVYKESVKLDLYKSLSYTDVLTGIKNRNAFENDQQNLKIDKSVCLIMMDINGLKRINDTFGHRFGDDIICRTAQAISKSFSSIGECYRIGGDEFAVICKSTTEIEVENAVIKMRCEIADENADSEVNIAVSCGYAFGSGDITDAAGLFDAADKSMYTDKNRERDLCSNV